MELPIDEIKPSGKNPRLKIDVSDLVESIQIRGVQVPIIVRRDLSDPNREGYIIIDGERRWTASKQLGLKTIPAEVKEVDEKQAVTLMVEVNIKRRNYDPIEMGRAIRLMREQKMTWASISEKCGFKDEEKKGRHAYTISKLPDLPEEVQKVFVNEHLPVEVGYALTTIPDKEKQIELVERIAGSDMPQKLALEVIREAKEVSEEPKEVAKPQPLKPRILGKKVTVYVSPDKSGLVSDFAKRKGFKTINEALQFLVYWALEHLEEAS